MLRINKQLNAFSKWSPPQADGKVLTYRNVSVVSAREYNREIRHVSNTVGQIWLAPLFNLACTNLGGKITLKYHYSKTISYCSTFAHCAKFTADLLCSRRNCTAHASSHLTWIIWSAVTVNCCINMHPVPNAAFLTVVWKSWLIKW